jgi:nicotinate-nucleotide pyrophosphorylase
MNEADRKALEAIAEQIRALAKSVEKLTDPETVKALEGLVEIAPTLKQLADGYRTAGVAGNFIKWTSGIATAAVALWALLTTFVFGDAR